MSLAMFLDQIRDLSLATIPLQGTECNLDLGYSGPAAMRESMKGRNKFVVQLENASYIS
jgi:hypothetical protein